jgi:four helix bundle protein
MKFEKFEDILAWQGSRIVIKQIYEIFKDHLDYGFKNQILRTSISIGNNIAE